MISLMFSKSRAIVGEAHRVRQDLPSLLISSSKSAVLVSCVYWVAFLQAFSGYADAGTGAAGRVLRRLAAPLRSHPVLQINVPPCGIGTANCLLANTPLMQKP